MTTYVPFTPSNTKTPSYQITLDGANYTMNVTWNLFGQRYVINIIDQNGNIQLSRALIQTPASLLLETLSWSGVSLTATAVTQIPHGYKVGTTLQLTVAGVNPDGYNGLVTALITGPSAFTYALSSDPGQVQAAGNVSYLIDLAQGIFDSTLVFRNGQFEITP